MQISGNFAHAFGARFSAHTSRVAGRFTISLLSLLIAAGSAGVAPQAIPSGSPPVRPSASLDAHTEAIQATTALHVLKFDPELLKTPAAIAQKLTATFTV